MDFYNTTYYDNASKDYSEKRYKGKIESYIQFFFQRRLKLLLNILEKNIKGRTGLSILEIGCADGIIIKEVFNKFPNNISNGLGVDISPEMIRTAKEKNDNKKIDFSLKDNNAGKYDIVLALGFLSPGIFQGEFEYIKKSCKENALVVITLASRNSIYTKLKLKGKEYVDDYWTHPEYEKYLQKDFSVIATYPYGLFVPKLWAFPWVGVLFQPIIENICRFMMPNLFHEKLFVLRKRS